MYSYPIPSTSFLFPGKSFDPPFHPILRKLIQLNWYNYCFFFFFFVVVVVIVICCCCFWSLELNWSLYLFLYVQKLTGGWIKKSKGFQLRNLRYLCVFFDLSFHKRFAYGCMYFFEIGGWLLGIFKLSFSM